MNLSEAIDTFIDGNIHSLHEVQVFLDQLTPNNQNYFVSALYFGRRLFDHRDSLQPLIDGFDKDAVDDIVPSNYAGIISGKNHNLVVDYFVRFRDHCRANHINIDSL